MLKLFVIVAVFAIPIFSHLFNHKSTKKMIIEGNYRRWGMNMNFSEKCRSVSSGVDIDFQKHESLYEAYENCTSEVGDYDQFGRDFRELYSFVGMAYRARYYGGTFTFTDKQKTNIVAFLQTYCQPVITFMKCDDVLAPIYIECYTTDEIDDATLGKASWLRVFENVCENNVENLANVITTKSGTNSLECAISKSLLCYRNYGVSYDPFSNPRLDDFCRFHNMTINCMGPAFKECGLSQTPDTLMRSFFTHIQSEKICENLINFTNRPIFF